jgi:hypothetical protein
LRERAARQSRELATAVALITLITGGGAGQRADFAPLEFGIDQTANIRHVIDHLDPQQVAAQGRLLVETVQKVGGDFCVIGAVGRRTVTVDAAATDGEVQ